MHPLPTAWSGLSATGRPRGPHQGLAHVIGLLGLLNPQVAVINQGLQQRDVDFGPDKTDPESLTNAIALLPRSRA